MKVTEKNKKEEDQPMSMQLVERHIIDKGDPMYKEIDAIAFLSKNLYNKANYIVRQEFINTSKEKESGLRKRANWIRYKQLQNELQNSDNVDYYALPTKVSQQVLKLLDKNWTSFFKSMREWKKNPEKFTGRPCLPKYKDKVDGRNILVYTIQSISKRKLKIGIVKLSGTNISVKTQQTSICQARIVPRIGHYIIEVVYEHIIDEKEVAERKLDKSKIASIDTGVNNLATVTSNQNGVQPQLINGRPLKSMNQFFNKEKATLQSYVGNKGTSNRIVKLTNKRTRKIDNYMHNASRKIVDGLVYNRIGTLVIGKNPMWKQEINIGKKNNQEFVQIPHARFIDMLSYKCKLVGIDVIIETEEYTSKCSFIDMEPICKHEIYKGTRKKRGLFVSADGTLINADCNGSGNILRKVFSNAFADGIEGVVVRPLRTVPYKVAPRKLVA